MAAQITVNVVGLQSAAVSADGSIIEEVDDSDSDAAEEAREGSEDDSSEELTKNLMLQQAAWFAFGK